MHAAFDQRRDKLCIDRLLNCSFCFVCNLWSDRIFLFICVIGDLRMLHLIRKKTYHVFRKIFRHNKCSIIVTTVNTIDCFLCRVCKHPANRCICFQSLDYSLTHIKLGVVNRNPLVVRCNCNFNIRRCIRSIRAPVR